MKRIFTLLASLLFLILSSTLSYANPKTPDVASFTTNVFDSLRAVAFTNTSILGSEPGERIAIWTFGDGTGAATPGLASITHVYPQPGTYTACLKIYRRNNAGDTVLSAQTCNNVVIAQICTAFFEKLQTNANLTFAYFKAFPWSNGNPRPYQVCWNFGDGHDTCINYATGYTGLYQVGHRYDSARTYQVCVTIRYDGGCTASSCRSIIIGNPAPPPVPDSCSANFEKLQTPNSMPLQVFLKALPAHNNNRKPSRICWNFGDGHDTCINYIENYTGLYLVSHRYAHADSFNVCVTIRYYGGCEAQKCRRIYVPNPQPSCAVNLVQIVPSNFSLVRGFVATPISSATPPARPVSICWRFGDGHDTCYAVDSSRPPGANLAISHRYANPGVYNACVRVVFQGGCIAENCKQVIILPAPPGPRLHLAPNPVQQVLNVEFLSLFTEAVVVRIVNSNGIPVRTYTRNVNAGINNWTELVSNLPPGIYTYVVQSPRQFITEHFIKL